MASINSENNCILAFEASVHTKNRLNNGDFILAITFEDGSKNKFSLFDPWNNGVYNKEGNDARKGIYVRLNSGSNGNTIVHSFNYSPEELKELKIGSQAMKDEIAKLKEEKKCLKSVLLISDEYLSSPDIFLGLGLRMGNNF